MVIFFFIAIGRVLSCSDFERVPSVFFWCRHNSKDAFACNNNLCARCRRLIIDRTLNNMPFYHGLMSNVPGYDIQYWARYSAGVCPEIIPAL